MGTEAPPPKTRRRAGRALYVEIDPALREFLDREAVQTHASRTAIVEEALRRLYAERHQDELVRETLPDLRALVHAELDSQLNELDHEIKAQVRGLEKRLGNRVSGLVVKAIREASMAHALASQAFERAYLVHFLTYNLLAYTLSGEQDGNDVAAEWGQEALDAARQASAQQEEQAAAGAGRVLRDKAPPADVSVQTELSEQNA